MSKIDFLRDRYLEAAADLLKFERVCAQGGSGKKLGQPRKSSLEELAVVRCLKQSSEVASDEEYAEVIRFPEPGKGEK